MESLPCFTPVLSVLHDAGLLNFCTDICDWNEELILQFYATLHVTGEADDINTWVLDWMTEIVITKHRPLNYFMPCQSVLPLKVLVVCTKSLNSLVITCKF